MLAATFSYMGALFFIRDIKSSLLISLLGVNILYSIILSLCSMTTISSLLTCLSIAAGMNQLKTDSHSIKFAATNVLICCAFLISYAKTVGGKLSLDRAYPSRIAKYLWIL